MTTFVLVHGAWHGAWCWERLDDALVGLGHDVVTMDLPVDDPEATFETYADVVCAAIDAHGATEPAVVVGHSLGGYTIPWVATKRPVQRLVYLCGLVPESGVSFVDQNRDGSIVDPAALAGLAELDARGCRSWVDPDLARTALYHDCPDDVVAAAFANLRPQAFARYRERWPFDELPSAPSTYVLCTEDRVVSGAWSRRAATELLKADLIELPGSHSPELSRPRELADVLHAIASR